MAAAARHSGRSGAPPPAAPGRAEASSPSRATDAPVAGRVECRGRPGPAPERRPPEGPPDSLANLLQRPNAFSFPRRPDTVSGGPPRYGMATRAGTRPPGIRRAARYCNSFDSTFLPQREAVQAAPVGHLTGCPRWLRVRVDGRDNPLSASGVHLAPGVNPSTGREWHTVSRAATAVRSLPPHRADSGVGRVLRRIGQSFELLVGQRDLGRGAVLLEVRDAAGARDRQDGR